MPPADLVASFEPVNPTSIIVVGSVLPFLALVAVFLRFWCRMSKKIRIWFDDWLIFGALASLLFSGTHDLKSKSSSRFFPLGWGSQ